MRNWKLNLLLYIQPSFWCSYTSLCSAIFFEDRVFFKFSWIFRNTTHIHSGQIVEPQCSLMESRKALTKVKNAFPEYSWQLSNPPHVSFTPSVICSLLEPCHSFTLDQVELLLHEQFLFALGKFILSTSGQKFPVRHQPFFKIRLLFRKRLSDGFQTRDEDGPNSEIVVLIVHLKSLGTSNQHFAEVPLFCIICHLH